MPKQSGNAAKKRRGCARIGTLPEGAATGKAGEEE
jgi:hypothetical protein